MRKHGPTLLAPSAHGPGSPIVAPGTRGAGGALDAPGRARPPSIDDRLAPPETRLEYLDGIEIFAAPAAPPHAMQHFDLTYVLGAHVATGYRGAVDMLTRTGETSDFAPDASIFSTEPDLETGGRRLEELAFEVTDKQALAVPTDKARKLIARGVRRVFCILVKQRRMLEWSRETDAWTPLPPHALLEDPCLSRPLSIDAILGAATADDAVARALLAKGVPALEAALAEREQAGKAEGISAGKAEGISEGEIAAKRAAVLAVLEARGLAVPRALSAAVAASSDAAQLDRWLRRAATVEQASEVLEKRRDRG